MPNILNNYKTIMDDYQKIALDVFSIEAQAIYELGQYLDSSFDSAVNMILNCEGKIIVTGMGKSGLIGRKIAATFASTGTPSFFMHPAEAYHGDLGMISPNDLIIAISNSGETEEILKLISFIKYNGNKLISLTRESNSTLAKNANVSLIIRVKKEACPLQLAPTTSTTATLVMGDALAIALMKARAFNQNDFASFHPGGNIGRKLLTCVHEVMRKNDLPIVSLNDDVKEIIRKMTIGRLGLAIIVENDCVKGIITDGDIRRSMENNETIFFSLKAQDYLTKPLPKTISPYAKLSEAEELFNKYKITSLLVIDKNSLVGVIQIYDLEYRRN